MASCLAKTASVSSKHDSQFNLRPLRTLASHAIMLVRSATLTPGTAQWTQLVCMFSLFFPSITTVDFRPFFAQRCSFVMHRTL
jgi:hypothetical protein